MVLLRLSPLSLTETLLALSCDLWCHTNNVDLHCTQGLFNKYGLTTRYYVLIPIALKFNFFRSSPVALWDNSVGTGSFSVLLYCFTVYQKVVFVSLCVCVGKFNWKGTIKAILRQAPEEGIALKKLRKKVTHTAPPVLTHRASSTGFKYTHIHPHIPCWTENQNEIGYWLLKLFFDKPFTCKRLE